ncbi:tyrosine-type recombinase/integrase [Sodalis sp. RH19]|uniref:tyrosine-type recombinase/integrase n=1 Tax=Sodalis sp. RH19 TaxID=3394334 RepID=UPI0039B4A861
MTQTDLDTFLYRCLESDIGEAERITQLGKIARQMGQPIDANHQKSVDEAKGYHDAVVNPLIDGESLTDEAIALILRKQSIDPTGHEQEIEQAAARMDMSRSLLYKAYQDYYSHDIVGYQRTVEQLKKQLPSNRQTANSPFIQAPVQQNKIENKLLLSDAWSMFIKEKGAGWSKPVARENNRHFELLLAVIGEKPVDEVTKQNIRDVVTVATQMPVRTRLPYSRMTLRELIEFDVPEEDLISPANVGKHLKIYKGFFKVYLKDFKDILTISPTEGVTFKATERRYGSYSKGEMKLLMGGFDTLPDDLSLYFKTLCYTGARRSEIAVLRKKNLRKDKDTGRWYIFIETGKTDHAVRQVPVHKSIEQQLRQHVKTKSQDDLIFDLPEYPVITQTLTKLLGQLGIPDNDDFGLKRRIHSIRHTFISNTITTNNQSFVQFIVGHSLSQSLGISARYTHRPPLADLLPVIDSLEWG